MTEISEDPLDWLLKMSPEDQALMRDILTKMSRREEKEQLNETAD